MIVHPHFDVYDEHIGRFGDNHIFVGNRDKGRTTKIICDLDRFLPKYLNEVPLELSKKALNWANDLANAKTVHEEFFLTALMQKDLEEAMKKMLL